MEDKLSKEEELFIKRFQEHIKEDQEEKKFKRFKNKYFKEDEEV